MAEHPEKWEKELLPIIQAFAEGKEIEYYDCNDDKWENLNDYNDDLTHKYDSDLNIMKIYKPNSEYKMIPTNFYKLDEEDIIWERPHPFEFEKALDVMKQGKVVRSLTNDTLYKFGDDEFLTLNVYFQTWDEAFLSYNVITGQWIEEDDI